MTRRWNNVVASLLGTGLILTLSCARARVPLAAGPGRMEALAGLDAVNAVLAKRTGSCVLVFHTPRSAPCRGMLQSIRQALPGLGAEAVIYTVDTDSDPLIGAALGIGSVPVVVFLRDGSEVDRWSAYRPTAMVRGALRRFFAPWPARLPA